MQKNPQLYDFSLRIVLKAQCTILLSKRVTVKKHEFRNFLVSKWLVTSCNHIIISFNLILKIFKTNLGHGQWLKLFRIGTAPKLIGCFFSSALLCIGKMEWSGVFVIKSNVEEQNSWSDEDENFPFWAAAPKGWCPVGNLRKNRPASDRLTETPSCIVNRYPVCNAETDRRDRQTDRQTDRGSVRSKEKRGRGRGETMERKKCEWRMG